MFLPNFPCLRVATHVAFLLTLLHGVQTAPVQKGADLDLGAGGAVYNHLAERGCFVSKEYTDDIPICSSYTYSVATYTNIMTEKGTISGKTCLFYLGLGGAKGQTLAQQWWCQKNLNDGTSIPSVYWGTALPSAYASAMINIGLDVPDLPNPADTSTTMEALNVYSRLVSQAIGELCSGDVYFFTPTSNDGTDPVDNVWNYYEYPALTRNSAVSKIVKVDPTLKEDGVFTDEGTEIWVAGDPEYGTAYGTGYSETGEFSVLERD
ncbi:hypothetical protein N7490_000041 [Penicillium lividum]|nr:hypothetical protein N7490_000041 [Penicillium lividum]